VEGKDYEIEKMEDEEYRGISMKNFLKNQKSI